MSIRIRSAFFRSVFGLASVVCLSAGINLASPAENVDILRSTPMIVSGYASARAFPETFTTQSEVIQALNSSPVLLVHMEAIRRAYHELEPREHDKLLEAIHKRRMTNEKDLTLGFDHGYAQMVFKQNKTGLFFLRKANDFFKDQFSALAYGMAQVEADINLEGSTPEITTTRKMDATFKLGDAVKRDAMNHQPGFWPSYIQVLEKMKPMPAYKSFSRRDFSLAYVPFGDTVTSLQGVSTSSLPLGFATLTDVPLGNVCSPEESSPLEVSPHALSGPSVAQQSAIFNGKPALIQFFQGQEARQYHVRVTGNDGQPMATFKTHTIPRRIVEDLDKDGVYEIVVRQYEENPLQPVIVYRYTPCGLELDQKIYESFQ
jgi:hypothetical protein